MRARWSDSKVFPPNTTKSDARSAPLRSHPSPLARSQFEAHAKKLIENDKPKDRLALVTTVREGIEIVNTAEYPAFLAAFLPAFQKVLETTPPHFEDGPEHKTRNAVLEMMNRLPHNEHLRPHDKLVLGLAMDALKTENEENALICLRIIFDLHRNFRPSLESEVAPFLEFVCEVYKGVGETVTSMFGDATAGAKPLGPEDVPTSVQMKATRSFKVQTECPLIVMLLFQLYSRLVPPNIQTLLPLMVQTIGLKGPALDEVPAHLKQAYGDMKGSQVKMVSFVTYLLRGFSEAILPHQQAISQSIVDLLKSCPDNVATRKELLVATRHVLSAPDFRREFYAHIDALLDEKVLVGGGRACYDSLRPLAYSFLAELVHHMRLELNLVQIRRIIYMFSKNVQDATLPVSIQMTCVRLMHHLVESIFRRRNDPSQAVDARANLIRILDITVAKFRTVRPQVKTLLENAKRAEAIEEAATRKAKESQDAALGGANESVAKAAAPSAARKDTSEEDEAKAAEELTRPIVACGGKVQTPAEAIKSLADTKALMRTLIIGMKTVVWSLTNFQGGAQQSQQMGQPPTTSGFREGELRRASGFVANGVRCLALYQGAECAEMCTHFAEALAVLDPRNFLDIVCLRLDALLGGGEPYELPPMVQLPHLLLLSSTLGRCFADALATHLVRDRLPALSEPSSPQSQLVLKLFSLLMHAVSKYSNCEAVLSPHIVPLVEACLKAMREVDDPSAYVRLLRYLFRALAQAKFDLLYREVVPVLQPCLDTLLALLHGPDTHALNDTVVELCLTLPARLSSILPHLPRLAHPLLRALKSTSSELQLLGLRTLEFWVDSLNPDFLDPCIAEVEPQLMLALWALLKPQQSGAPFGAKALQMLGKLGGRSRCFLREPLELEAKSNPEHGLRLILTFKPETSFLVPLDRCIQLMKTILSAPPVPNLKGAEALVEHRRQALSFLRACLSSVLNVSSGVARAGADEGEIKKALDGVVSGWFGAEAMKIGATNGESETGGEKSGRALGNKTKTQLEAEKAVFKQLLTTVVAAEADPTLKKANDGFVDAVSEHFAMLFVSGMAPLVPGGSGRSGAALAKEAAAAAAAAKAKKGGDDAEDEDDGKKDKKKTPPPPSPKKTRGRRGKKEDEEDEEKEDDEKEDDEKKKEKEKDVEMVDAEAPVKTRPKRAAASLKTLDATLFLEALMDAMESGKRPQAEAALHAIRVFIDGVMTLACDSAVVGVSEEDAADARAAVAAAEAAMKAEAEAKAAAEKARKEGKNPPSDEGASGEDADMQKVPEAKEEETKKEEEKEPKTTRSSKRGASSSKKSAKTDEEEEGEENDKADKEETSDKNKKAPEKEAGSERAAADAARATAAAAAAAALHAPVPPAMRSLVTELLPRLMHCCFQKSWQSTVGGVAGIDALSRVLPISALRAHLPRILHALLRALWSLPPHAVVEVRAATEVFHRVLKAATPEGTAIRGEDAPPGLETALGVLSEELFSTSSSATVRPVVEAAVAGLSKRSGLEVSKVLDVKPAHVGGLLSRPLHTRHIDLQTQVVCILNFCLSTHPEPLMRIHAQLVGLLQEALALAENDDPTAIKAGPGATESLHALRAACIRLMCSAMACPELKAPAAGQEQLAQLRQRIITMFFKSLTSRSTEVVDIAKQGLKRVIQQQSLSKELLQSSLRPILVNLAHYKNLTMPLLSGLERLLELLSNWFNPTLGEKLLEHLRRWLEPDKAVAAAGQPQQARPPPKDIKIAAAMINLFHLLPQAAGKFLEPLVMLTMQLEKALPPSGVHSEVNSLYRKPLTKFLARYASDTVDFFLARLAQPAFFLRFLDMIRMKEGENIRAELAASAPKIIAAAFTWPRPGAGTNPAADAQASEGLSGVGGGSDLHAYHGLKLITTLIKFKPDWLHTQAELVKVLWGRWSSEARLTRLRSEEMLALPELRESKHLIKCFINVASKDRSQVKYLFDVLSIFEAKSCVDYTFLEDFYKDVVSVEYTPEERRAVLMYFLTSFKKRTSTPSELVSALRLVVLPMLEHTLKDVAADPVKMAEAKIVITEEAVESVVVDLLETADDENSAVHSEPMRIQLLRLGTLLIRNLPDELVSHRKELIKFGWNHLKSEDSGAKQWAFVNVCHFLEAYQAPEKIVLQVFVALLRACQPEAKELVRQALGALTPALPKRLPQGDHKYPIWIRYTKKILVEEGHSLPHLIHVWNLIVQHESHFYPSRAQFVPQMVNSLSRLGLPSSSPPENRVLSISLVELILDWEAARVKRVTEGATAKEDDAKEEEEPEPEPEPEPAATSSKRTRRDSAGEKEKPAGKRTRGNDGKKGKRAAEEAEDDEDEDPKGKKDKESIMPSSAEKDKDVDMGDADDIDLDDKSAKSDKGKAAPEVVAPPDADDFKPSTAMEEIMVNFLVRMAFLTGEAKDKEMIALHARTVALLRRALSAWPDANIKFAFIEKLLASASANGGDATGTLRTGLGIFNIALECNATKFITANAAQLAHLLEPCFNSQEKTTHDALARALARAMFPPPPAGSPPGTRGVPPPETKILQMRLDELCAKHVAAAITGNPALPNVSAANPSLACVLACVAALAERQRRVVDRYLPHLIKLLSRLTHELNQASAAGQAPPPQPPQRTAPGQAPVVPTPEYGSVAHCMAACVRLIATRVIPAGGEHKQLFLRMLLQLINDQATHGAVLMATLDALKGWADDTVAGAPPGAVGAASAIPAQLPKAEPEAAEETTKAAGDDDAAAEAAAGAEPMDEDAPKPSGGKEKPGGGKEKPGARKTEKTEADADATDDEDEDDADEKEKEAAKKDEDDAARAAEEKPAEETPSDPPSDPFPEPNHPGSLSAKETVLFLSKLAHLTRLGREVTQTAEWEEKLLGTLHALCASEGHHAVAIRQEVFVKVERNHLLGLRTRHPKLHKQFFQLYHSAVGKSLFHRLQYILAGQEWDAMADTFWLKQGLDLILSILADDERITLAPNSAQIPSLLPTSEDPKAPPPATPSRPTGRNAPAKLAEKTQAMLDRHAAFVAKIAKLRVSDLTSPLREVATRNAHVAYYLWVLVFPIVWATLQREEQMQLAKPMIALLSKEYHQRQAAVRPNVVQALLEGISLSQPQPKIPSELIKFLGKTYNAWHIAIALLENHVVRYPQETRCFDALAELYRLLGEQDVLVGLWRQRCNSEVTRAGLALTQHGHWQEAQDVFFRGMQRASAGQVSGVTKTELCLWETNWLNSAKQLNQWELISDFSRSVDHTELQLHSLWRQNDWSGVRDLLPTSAATSEVEETPETYVIRVYSALNAGRVAEAEQCWKQAVKLLLDRWWKLPEVGAAAHVPVLHSFHVLVELQESTRILVELSNAQRPQHPNPGHCRTLIQDVMETWRLRTPNRWDPVPWWNEVLTWRGYVYGIIATAAKSLMEIHPQLMHQGHQLDQLGLRDRAWGINKLASTARRHRMGEVANAVLSKQQGHIEVQEAFSKLREQSKACLEMEGETVTGLNALETTSLDFFHAHHKAELFRLKGQFQERMGDGDGAHASYATALSLCKQLSKAWISWGEFCGRQARANARAALHAAAAAPPGAPPPKDDEGARWVEYAATCYLQAAKHGPQRFRHELVNVLHLLAFSDHTNAVGRAMAKHVDAIQRWVWIPYIPQLLLSLLNREAPHAKALLLRLAQAHPQAIYCSLRTFLLERREAATRITQTARQLAAKAQESAGAAQKVVEGAGGAEGEEAQRALAQAKTDKIAAQAAAQAAGEATVAFDSAKEVMERLRHKHSHLVTELEVLLSELGARFASSPEERLLVVVYTLLHRCYKYPTATTAEVPASFKKELTGVCRACFSADTSTKHADFVAEYKAQYERDLDPEQPTFPSQLSELIDRLKRWKTQLQADVEDRLPTTLRLEDESPALRGMRFAEVEVPGQYNGDAAEGAPDRPTKLERVGAEVRVVRRHGTSHRCLTFLGVDGGERRFLVQTSLTPAARGEERMLQLLRSLNASLAHHTETRRRGLSYYTPSVVPVWPQVRLVEDDAAHGTYGEVYEINCARYGREADLPISIFKTALNDAVTGKVQGAEAVLDLRLKAFADITQNHVTENIFSQYMYKTLPTGSHLWTFKRQLCQQLALSSFISALLRIGGRTPQKIMFAKNTGRIFMLDFHPAFDSKGMTEFVEPVPFRLTRNLHTFFTPFGVKGDFVAAMAAAAQACAAPGTNIETQLMLFYRDQLMVWPWRRMTSAANAAGGGIGPTPADVRVMARANVDEVLKRLPCIAPTPPRAGAPLQEAYSSVQKGVLHLVEAAINPKNLSRMEPTWAAWL